MSIDKAIKTPRGYGRQPVMQFLEISQGERPSMAIAPAKYIPVQQQDQLFNEWYTILAGQIVAFDSAGALVPANGGTAQDIVYTANDVSYTVDQADQTILVAAAKTISNGYLANKPSGWAFFHWYSSAIEDRYYNYILQPRVSILCDYFISVPLKLTAQNAFASGDFVMPNGSGQPIPWDTVSVEQVCGRAIKVGTALQDEGLAKVRTMKGMGLAGQDTGGMLPHLYGTHEGGGAITTEILINICAM